MSTGEAPRKTGAKIALHWDGSTEPHLTYMYYSTPYVHQCAEDGEESTKFTRWGWVGASKPMRLAGLLVCRHAQGQGHKSSPKES